MKQNLKLYLLLIPAIGIIFSCQNKNTKTDHSGDEKTTVSQNCDQVHWSHHEGHEGPENWKDLCPGFSDCGGQAQSPVNIVKAELGYSDSLPELKINYHMSACDIINNGHTVQFNISEGSSITIGEKEFQLLQFHYHALSEHTIDGEHSPLEVHFVHKYSDSELAVIGIMYEEGEANELFSKYLEYFPTEKGEYKSEDSIDVAAIIPANMSFFQYAGSLTTPPCSEIVSWYVMTDAIAASKDQIDKFSTILYHNYRPIQALNGRLVYEYHE